MGKQSYHWINHKNMSNNSTKQLLKARKEMQKTINIMQQQCQLSWMMWESPRYRPISLSPVKGTQVSWTKQIKVYEIFFSIIPRPGVICGLSLLLVLYSAPRGFSPGTPVFPFPQKPTFPNSNSIWECTDIFWTSSWELLGAPWVNKLHLHLHLHLHFYIIFWPIFLYYGGKYFGYFMKF